MVAALLDSGADPNLKNKDENTPLHVAAAEGREEVVKHLVKKGADVAALNRQRWQPSHWAAAGGHSSVLKQLVLSGADLHATTSTGHTCLHLCAAAGHPPPHAFFQTCFPLLPPLHRPCHSRPHPALSRRGCQPPDLRRRNAAALRRQRGPHALLPRSAGKRCADNPTFSTAFWHSFSFLNRGVHVDSQRSRRLPAALRSRRSPCILFVRVAHVPPTEYNISILQLATRTLWRLF